jgi:hypothetical protein
MNSVIFQKMVIITVMIVIGVYCVVCSLIHIGNEIVAAPVFLLGISSFARSVYLIKNGG